MTKTGTVIVLDRYTRALIKANPNVLFVFGDNLERVGYGGQAAEARGCLNSVGIPTKISPSQYIFDIDVDENADRFKIPILQAFVTLHQHLQKGGVVVWPKDGVGTGLARLDITAPRLFKAIEGLKQNLFDNALLVKEQTLTEIEQG